MDALEHIRNFSIISHIDHGKSTLADRFLELTGTVEKRKMHAQLLDQMDLERERGITIKMQPVRMFYQMQSTSPALPAGRCQLNLIDTPGHIDFSYEVSRALAACEGAILLVDASQGVQAQTLSHFYAARSLGLPLLPALNKIDLSHADVPGVSKELIALGFEKSDIQLISAKEGIGVEAVLQKIIRNVPHPVSAQQTLRALIFDSIYDEHGGVIAYVRVVDGNVHAGDRLILMATKRQYEAKAVGVFAPFRVQTEALSAGEIGYVATGIKEPDAVRIGDTITTERQMKPSGRVTALPGYHHPQPMVWASFFPEDQSTFAALGDALKKLKLNDASLSFKEHTTVFLGRGYQCGFLGTLHLEIIAERIRREFHIEFVVTSPSVSYRVHKKGSQTLVSSAHLFPVKGDAERIEEPMINATVIMPERCLSALFKMREQFEMSFGEMESFGASRVLLKARMPLRTFVKDFFETLHRATSGYASINYTLAGWQEAHLKRVDIMIAGDAVEAFSRVVAPGQMQRVAKQLVEDIKNVLPREQFEVRIQAVADGRIVASARLSALKKDVTGHLYGGDRTRKMKLWQKQKKGKQKLKGRGTVHISTETFLKLLRK